MNVHIELPINASVACLDGDCGHSLELVVNPQERQVTHLVVQENTVERNERLIPVGMISATGPDGIRLCCTRDELQDFEIFCDRDVLAMAKPERVPDVNGTYHTYSLTRRIIVENKTIPPGEFSFDQNTVVEATDGRVGRLVKLLINPEEESITHLVVSSGSPFSLGEVNIPASAIRNFTSYSIELNLSKKQVKKLRRIRSLP